MFHQTVNAQNTMLTKEIHDQGKIILLISIYLLLNYLNILYDPSLKTFSADSSYCWAFSISSMLRHSLNLFLREREKKCPQDEEKISQAEKYLNGPEFHKRLRNCFEVSKRRKSF